MMTPEDFAALKSQPSLEVISYARRKGKMKPVPWSELPTHIQTVLTRDKEHIELVSRNSPCPCGSGKRFKRCCQHD